MQSLRSGQWALSIDTNNSKNFATGKHGRGISCESFQKTRNLGDFTEIYEIFNQKFQKKSNRTEIPDKKAYDNLGLVCSLFQKFRKVLFDSEFLLEWITLNVEWDIVLDLNNFLDRNINILTKEYDISVFQGSIYSDVGENSTKTLKT